MNTVIAEDQIRKFESPAHQIGKGGNGTVYCIPNTDFVFKRIDLRFSTDGSRLANRREVKKYKRFRDEIQAVVQNQGTVSGILPIVQFGNLPQSPNRSDFLYYVMPFAKPLDGVEQNTIKGVVRCFHSLFTTLAELHARRIAHRDIKPSNIYLHNKEFAFGDFGLVYFPKKQKVSSDERRIGPWATIAPEMEREPFKANPFPADVYSLAKTFWIVLTSRPMSFEGQYNHHDESLNIYNSLEGYSDFGGQPYLSIIHTILRDCTSNDPLARPTASQIAERLKLWLDADIGVLCRLEWNFYLGEIVSSKPKKIVWEDPSEIARILNIIGKTHGLNHTFLPSGGGLDLHSAKICSDDMIEVDIQSTEILVPRRLQLSLYEDTQWNHFYLETKPLIVDGPDLDGPDHERYRDQYLQIEQKKFAPTWYQNYSVYNGTVVPESSRVVTVVHHGSYVIFPKISFYNLGLDHLRFGTEETSYMFDPYDGLHQKFANADAFDEFIETIAHLSKKSDLPLRLPLSLLEKYAHKVIRERPDLDQHEREIQFCNRIESEPFQEVFETQGTTTSPGPMEYEFNIEIGTMNSFVLGSTFFLRRKRSFFTATSILKDLKREYDIEKSTYRVKSYSEAMKYRELLEVRLVELSRETASEFEIAVSLRSRRVLPMLLDVLDKSKILAVLASGRDDVGGALVLDSEGSICLQAVEDYSRVNTSNSALLCEIEPHSNVLGSHNGVRSESFVEHHHHEFLSIALYHLKKGKYVESFDEVEFHSNEELAQLIEKQNQKYTYRI